MIEMIQAGTKDIVKLFERQAGEQPDVSQAVEAILKAVKEKGDEAVLDYCQQFDGVRPTCLQVSEAEIKAARDIVGQEFLDILEEAAQNIRVFHGKQVRQGFIMTEKPGIVMGQKITPLEKVGVYVPGGTAAYPSTVLMDVIPAKIAGVKQIVMTTPPAKDGSINPVILAAASVAGVTEIYKVGGAQAVGALSYGTQTIPQVDKIVGPGNIYVATAKKMVYGLVDIDMIAGPSDVLVVADETASGVAVAADMLAQAEHDVNATAILVTTNKELGIEVQQEINRQLNDLSRKEIAEQSIDHNGKIILVEGIEQGMEIANALAPEHMELCVKDPFALLPQVKNAGSIFLGHNTPEALGDYFAGPNHTLPTGGTARFYSPLSVDDFIKKSSYLYYDYSALQKVSDKVQAFALKEGLDAHAKSVKVRMNQN